MTNLVSTAVASAVDQSTARVLYSPNPFAPKLGQTECEVVIEDNSRTVADILRSSGVDIDNRAVYVQLNAKPLPRDQWDTEIKQGDIINVSAAVEGNGSNIIATILTIAVMIYAPYLTGVTTGLKAGTTAFKIASAVIAIGGAALINAVFPPSLPKGGGGAPQTYTISGTQNTMRLFEPMPITYGDIRVVPDLGARPYTELLGKDSYLYQIFNFGLSDVELSDIRIGNTPISEFKDVVWEESGPDGKLTLFPSNVDTIAGGSIKASDGWVTRTTSVDTTAIGIDIEGTLFNTSKKGNPKDETIVIQIEYRAAGSSDPWLLFMEYDPDRRETQRLGRAIISTPVSPASTFITNGSFEPVRENFYRTVPKGQYDVRIRRVTGDFDVDDNKRKGDLTWSQLRSYQPDEGNYYGQKRLAVIIRANGQLNGQIDQLNAIAKARIPVFNGTSWVTEVSRNPGFQYLHWLRGKFDEEGKHLFGGALSDSRINVPQIVEFAQWCEFKNLYCDINITKSSSVSEVATMLLRCGRGRISAATGKYGVIWEEAQRPVTQMFTMANIKAGSFRRDYISDNLADEIIVSFVNRDMDWTTDTVRVLMPGVTNPINSTNIDVPGVTTLAQAAREANLQAAKQYYFNGITMWETDIEGARCSINDIVSVTHDLSMWGAGGRLRAGSTDTVLKLDRPVEFIESTQPWISVRHPNGLIEHRQVVLEEEQTDTITLEEPLTYDPSEDEESRAEDYVWQFNPSETPGKKLRIINAEFLDESSVRFTAIDELDEYYEAEDGDFVYVPPWIVSAGYPAVTDVTVTEQVIDYGNTTAKIFVNWRLNNALGVRVRVKEFGQDWDEYGVFYGAQMSFTVNHPTTLTIEVSPHAESGLLPGYGIFTLEYTVVSIGQLPEDIPAIMPRVSGLQLFGTDPQATEFTGKDAKFTWRKVAAAAIEVGDDSNGADAGGEDTYFKDYQVQVFNEAGDQLRTEFVKDNSYTYTFEKNYEDNDDEPVRTFIIEVRARGIRNQVSPSPARLKVSNPAPAQLGGVSVSAAFQSAWVNFTNPTDPDFAGVRVWMSETSGFSPSDANHLLDVNTNNVGIDNLVAGTTYYVRIAGYDAFGKTGLNISSEFAVATYLIEMSDLDPELVEAIESSDTELIADMIEAETAARISGDEVLDASISAEATSRAAGDTALASDITTVQAIASSRNRVFSQASAPTATATGDLWFDSDDGNKVYRWDGSVWQPTDDTRIAATAAAVSSETTARVAGDTALASDITTVQAIAASKNVTFRQTTAPTGGTYITGDLWFDSDDNNKLYRWNGSSWVATDDARIDANTAAITTEATARANGDSANASSISTLSTTVSGHTSSISTQATSINGLEAQYTVKVDVGGRVAGYGLASTAVNGTPLSQFTVLADKFAIFNGSSATNPFTVAGGTVFMTNAVANNFAVASITADKMNVSSLSSITATIGLLRTATTGARVEIEDNQIRVYDSAGTLRVAIGVGI